MFVLRICLCSHNISIFDSFDLVQTECSRLLNWPVTEAHIRQVCQITGGLLIALEFPTEAPEDVFAQAAKSSHPPPSFHIVFPNRPRRASSQMSDAQSAINRFKQLLEAFYTSATSAGSPSTSVPLVSAGAESAPSDQSQIVDLESLTVLQLRDRLRGLGLAVGSFCHGFSGRFWWLWFMRAVHAITFILNVCCFFGLRGEKGEDVLRDAQHSHLLVDFLSDGSISNIFTFFCSYC